MIERVSIATRVTGTVVAGSYLLGLTDGPVMMVVGGLALVTFGRGLVVGRSHEALAGAALAVMAGAIGVSALRWGSFALADLRGAQAVLGPTLWVGPQEVAAAAAGAAAGAVIASGIWRAEAPAEGSQWLSATETVVAALALVTAFWGPTPRGDSLVGWIRWAALVAGAGGAAWLVALVIARIRRGFAWAWVAGAAVATIGGGLWTAVAR